MRCSFNFYNSFILFVKLSHALNKFNIIFGIFGICKIYKFCGIYILIYILNDLFLNKFKFTYKLEKIYFTDYNINPIFTMYK